MPLTPNSTLSCVPQCTCSSMSPCSVAVGKKSPGFALPCCVSCRLVPSVVNSEAGAAQTAMEDRLARPADCSRRATGGIDAKG